MYIHWPCPVRSGLVVGVVYVEIADQSSRAVSWLLCAARCRPSRGYDWWIAGVALVITAI